jgi:GT2 family glycosyltransferase
VRLVPAWLAELAAPLEAGEADVAAGFFRADPRTTFELAMGATVLPAEREIRPETFLPSSRSVAFTRAAWRAAGGYPEWLDYCEDVVFDLALRELGCRFAWRPAAVAWFRPRGSLGAFWRQYYRYARGDGKANLFFRRHVIRYAVYAAGGVAAGRGFGYKRWWLGLALAGLPYLLTPFRRLLPQLRGRPWRERVMAAALVPLIRLTGDLAKMAGYPVGWWWRLTRRSRTR